MASGFGFDTSGFSAKQMERKLISAVSGLMKIGAARGETFMKHNAPWTDRTSNARNGLFAKYRRISDKVLAILFGHTVDYGVYLEEGTENMRPYPIVRPTIDYIAKQLQHSIYKLLDRLH